MLGVSNISFATDCSDMISMIENEDAWPSFAAELATFRSFMRLFSSFSIRFLPRSSNVRADCLAKKAGARS